MNPLRPALALLLAAALCAPAVQSGAAAPARIRHLSATQAQAAPTRSAETTGALADRTVIVRLKGRLTADKLSSVYRTADTSAGGVAVIRGDVLSFKVPAGQSVRGFADRLEDSGQIRYAEPNYLRQLASYTPPPYSDPNDPDYLDSRTMTLSSYSGTLLETYANAQSWWIRDVHAVAPTGANAWKIGYTGSDTTGKYPLRAPGDTFKVAVLDTGLYLDHPDRSPHMVAGGGADVTPVDPSAVVDASSVSGKLAQVSHGTCVSGEIAAAAGNGIGTLGVANDTVVESYKVYWGNGISDDDLIAAIHQAADNGCKVINMSIAGGPATAALQAAIDYAWNKGCVIVAASGNKGAATVSNPAAMNHVVAVGALGHDASGARARADYSNYGSALDLVAPGSSVWGLAKPGATIIAGDDEPGYHWWDGTSMASPVVAGGIAWLWRAAPWMSNSEVVALVKDTANDLGPTGRDNAYGYGDLDMAAAYKSLMSEYPLLHKPTITALSEDNARNIRIKWAAVPGYGVTYDVSVDGNPLASGTTATSITLPYDTSVSAHVIAVAAHSERNWADDTARDSYTVYPSAAIPEVISLSYRRGQLLWTDTEAGRTHTDLLSVDGGPAIEVTDGAMSTAALSLGSHTATLTVRDQGDTTGAPKAITFTVRPAPSVSRTTGSDRYRYATALGRVTFARATTAVLVGGAAWVDAFSAAPLAHLVGGPVLPTSRTALPSTTKTELARLGVKTIIIVGDTGDVSTSLRNSLAKSYTVTRISGKDRYETANALAREIARRSGGTVADGKVVVVGDSYAAALSASAVAARKGWPLLYTRATAVSSATRSAITAIGATNSLIVGSTTSVSTAARRQLPGAERIPGSGLSIPVNLAAWATTNHPHDFSGERIYVANSTQWTAALGLPAASAEKGGLVLATTPSLASPVKSYYQANSETAVTTRIVAGSDTVSSSAYTTIKNIVGAP